MKVVPDIYVFLLEVSSLSAKDEELYSGILSLLCNSCEWALIFYEKYTLQFVCCNTIICYYKEHVTLFVYLVPMLKRSTNFITYS
jgi:hypothetical protein